jgi:hypothetical protein
VNSKDSVLRNYKQNILDIILLCFISFLQISLIIGYYTHDSIQKPLLEIQLLILYEKLHLFADVIPEYQI